MNSKGKRVFTDNIDDILSEKIIGHTKLSESSETQKQPTQKKIKPATLPLIFLTAAIIIALNYFFSALFPKKG